TLQGERRRNDTRRAAAVPDPYAGVHEPVRNEPAPEPRLPRPVLSRAPLAIALGRCDPVAMKAADHGGIRLRPAALCLLRILQELRKLEANGARAVAPHGKCLVGRQRGLHWLRACAAPGGSAEGKEQLVAAV